MGREIVISECDIGLAWQDAGPWRSYALEASGEDFETLMESATISEIDQDGGELSTYGIDDAPNEVYDKVQRIINERINRSERHEVSLPRKN